MSARTFFPCQFTVTVNPSRKTKPFSTIKRVGAIPVNFSSGKKNKALRGHLAVSLHSCLAAIVKYDKSIKAARVTLKSSDEQN